MFLAEHATDNGEEEFLTAVIVSSVDSFYFLRRSADILVLGPNELNKLPKVGFGFPVILIGKSTMTFMVRTQTLVHKWRPRTRVSVLFHRLTYQS